MPIRLSKVLGRSQNEPTIIQAAATGISIDPADQASITLNLRQSATTDLEARAKLRAFTEQVTAELSALGFPKRAISFEESNQFWDTSGLTVSLLKARVGTRPQ